MGDSNYIWFDFAVLILLDQNNYRLIIASFLASNKQH